MQEPRRPERNIIEALPILSYDTDAGLGYGGKLVLRGQLGADESFDFTVFQSTKGERWYKFVFSYPDMELRQGTVYPIALDFTIDYDKWIKNSFYGIGAASQFSDREYYSREPIDVFVTLSRGFTESVVLQSGVRYKAVRNYGFASGSALMSMPPAVNAGRADYVSAFWTLRFDGRDSYFNPHRGVVVQGEGEWAFPTGSTTTSFTRYGIWLLEYSEVAPLCSVLALRFGAQQVDGRDLPVQTLLSVGGSSTLRGSPQDRYVDRAGTIVNIELRVPIWWRFEGVAGADAGTVGRSLGAISLRHVVIAPCAGLRLIMQTFVVRLDVGFGSESTGFYLNFGQMF